MLQDAASDLAIWGAAEIATTIMATCIPVLRVLLRYVVSSAHQYHSTLEPSTGPQGKGTKTTTTIMATCENQSKSRAGRDYDTGSDRSILERPAGVANQIVHTSEIIVEFHNQHRKKRDEDSDSTSAYEMGESSAGTSWVARRS